MNHILPRVRDSENQIAALQQLQTPISMRTLARFGFRNKVIRRVERCLFSAECALTRATAREGPRDELLRAILEARKCLSAHACRVLLSAPAQQQPEVLGQHMHALPVLPFTGSGTARRFSAPWSPACG
jgi:hypothetical protein